MWPRSSSSGAVFVADEIQSGFARTGVWFACESEGVVPDLMTVAKGMAGGMPLSGVVGRAELMDAAHASGLGGTYGGNPVACAASLAAFDAVDEWDLLARARHLEDVIRAALEPLVGGVVGEVRGRGAMMALEFVMPGTKEPNPDAAKAVASACLAAGVLILTCGTFGNVVRLLPPLVISDDLLNEALGVLATAIAGVDAATV